MTPAVFKNVLFHGFMSLERVNLLVFDECHRATGDDPYVGVMKLYKEVPKNAQPRVLGLTASVVNSQVDVYSSYFLKFYLNVLGELLNVTLHLSQIVRSIHYLIRMGL